MTRRSKVVLGSAGILAALLAAAITLLLTFDMNRLKPFINEKVSAAIGRQFTIRGDLRLTWQAAPPGHGLLGVVPWPRLAAKDLLVANPDWASAPSFATLQGVSFELNLLPLLRHRIEIPLITLVQPTVDVERLADGRDNWTFNPPPSQPGQPSNWSLQVGTIVFDKTVITVNDAVKHITLTVQIDPLGKPIPFADILRQHGADDAQKTSPHDYLFGIRADGLYGKATVHGQGKMGGVLALTDPDDAFPVEVDLTSGDTHISSVGTVTDPLHVGALDMQLQASSTSMAHLYALTGVNLPDTPPFATAGHLWATLTPNDSQFHYDHFTGHMGGSDLEGNLRFELKAPRPRLSGEVNSRLLQFRDLAPLLAGDRKTPDQAAPEPPPKPQPPDRLLPVAGFRTDRWNAMDADVRITMKRITRETTIPVEDVSAHLLMDNGKLTLAPLQFAVAGGTVKTTLTLDGGSLPLQGDMTLELRRLQLPKLFPHIPAMQTALGEFNGDLKLKSSGNSVAVLAANSSGEVKVLLEQGMVSRNLLELAGLNVANVVAGKLFGDKTANINCAASDLVVQQGQVDAKLLVVDTDDAQITVDGGLSLATEQMAFTVNPHTKGLRVFSLRTPLYVRGTFKQPKVGVNMGRLALRGGAVVGLGLLTPWAALLPLIAPSHQTDTQCGKLITAMQTPSSTLHPGQAARQIGAEEKLAGEQKK